MTEQNSDFLIRARDQILGCIPRDLIVTAEAKQLRDLLEAEKAVPPNKPPVDFSARRVSKEESLRDRGVQLDLPRNARFYAIKQRVESFSQSNKRKELTSKECEEVLPHIKEFEQQLMHAEDIGIPAELTEDAVDFIHGAAAQITFATDLEPGSDVAVYAIRKLFEAAESPFPEYRASDDQQWDERSPGWGWPQSRIVAAEGLLNLARRADFCSEEILRCLVELSKDRVPAVRHQILTHCLALWNTARDTMWQIIRDATDREERLSILHFFLEGVLLRLPTEEAHELIMKVYQKHRKRDKGPVRGACAIFFVRRAIWESHSESEKLIGSFVSDPTECSPELGALIPAVAEMLIYDESNKKPVECKRVRDWTFSFYENIAHTCQRRIQDVETSQQGRDAWEEKAQEEVHMLLQLVQSIVRQLSFTLDEQKRQLDIPAIKRFFHEALSLLGSLCEVRFVHIAYELFGVLDRMASINPSGALEFLHRSVTAAKADGIHYEHMAATKVVTIVETYLAQHKDLLKQRTPQGQLLDILDAFVEAGWIEAEDLTYRLSEVFR